MNTRVLAILTLIGVIVVTVLIEPGMVFFAALISLPYLIIMFLVRDEYVHSTQQVLEVNTP
jgi:hypothetical protein